MAQGSNVELPALHFGERASWSGPDRNSSAGAIFSAGQRLDPCVRSLATGQGAEAARGLGVALGGGLAIPLQGLLLVLLDAPPVRVQGGERGLAAAVALEGGQAIPLDRFLLVLFGPPALLVCEAEVA